MPQLEVQPIEDADVDAAIDLWRRCDLVVSHNDPVRGFYESIGYAHEPRAAMAKRLEPKRMEPKRVDGAK